MMLSASHSYLQLLQYIRSSIRYANAFTPHWMVDGTELFDLQGQVLYKQLSRATHVEMETWPQSPCYALYSVSTLTISIAATA